LGALIKWGDQVTEQPQTLREFELKPVRENTALLFRLRFRSSSRQTSTTEFEMSADDAMALLHALQSIQRRHGWRVPQFLGERRRKPQLRVVKKEDE
jgi:hypothetical protein